MKQINIKKIILPNLPYVLFIYLFDKVAQAFRLAGGADLSAKVLNLGNTGFCIHLAAVLWQINEELKLKTAHQRQLFS